jgi:tyrosyl-tRNA synthetase
MGHKVLLVIGDFTGMIGDPSGRLDVRAALTNDEVRANMATYEEQSSRIIDLKDKSIERHYNSEWMDKLTIRGWVGIIKDISANHLLQREDFRNRISTGQRLSMAELEYALYMGYDSVVLNPDAELGGIDQYLNMHMCRQMMANAKQKPEIIISYNLLAGTTGERDGQGRLVKMSKSRGNYIPITASPEDMYGKVMSIPDEIMWIWYRELTELTRDEINLLKQSVEREDLHPKDVKQLLARIVVGTFNYFDRQIIEAAERDFNTKFGKDALLTPDSVEVLRINSSELLIDRLTQVTNRSKNEVRRLLQQQGVRILKGGEYIPIGLDDLLQPTERFEGAVIKIGKRHYYRFEV